MAEPNPYDHLLRTLQVNGSTHRYYDPTAINDKRYDRLPYSIRVLLEAAVRCCDDFHVRQDDVESILDWHQMTSAKQTVEVPFKPSRVILQDFTGVPAVVDFAAMRDAVQRLGGDPQKINPVCPSDLVIDHSVQVDYTRAASLHLPQPSTPSLSSGRRVSASRVPDIEGIVWSPADPSGRRLQARVRRPARRAAGASLVAETTQSDGRALSGPTAGRYQPPHRRQAPTTLPTAPPPALPGCTRAIGRCACIGLSIPACDIPAAPIKDDICPFHELESAFYDALKMNQDLEFERNQERFQFLKWGSQSFDNMLIVPPGSGIVHQVNLEYLARVVFSGKDGLLYPDSLVGTDSHTTMINGLGVVGWGVGGIEAEAVMLGQSISMVLPAVVGYKISGQRDPLTTSTDVVLTITKHLRQIGVVGKFVEFFGSGVSQMSIADRATISNMCPEYGATVGFFPVDERSIEYLRQTGRDEDKIAVIRAYLTAVGMFRDFNDDDQNPSFSEVFHLDLSTVVSSLSGPKRPHDRVSVADMPSDFQQCLVNPVGFKGYGLSADRLSDSIEIDFDGATYRLGHGSVVIAAITSCTNTSNPSVMLGAASDTGLVVVYGASTLVNKVDLFVHDLSTYNHEETQIRLHVVDAAAQETFQFGLLARKAVEKGLTVAPWIKTSLSPGSGVVTHYLQSSGVMPFLKLLGFDIVGYGCMTCIGNSGPLPVPVVEAIEKLDLVCCGVLSGNRNFEGRIHPHVRANYLSSPPLVVAYAIAGRADIDFQTTPLGSTEHGDVYLRDIWPTRDEIQALEIMSVIPALFKDVYSKICKGNESWNELSTPQGTLYPWNDISTYIKRPPFFDTMKMNLPPRVPIEDARALLFLGDSVTTDHISPAGSIARNSPAARYLADKGLAPRAFNSYGSRRGNDAVMQRGTFANVRLVNRLLSGRTGPRTLHLPSNNVMDVFDAAERYRADGTPLILLAGKDYGCGSSRDWAAKGPFLLGVKAVLAESYERIHRSNLVGMGLIPLQYSKDQTADSLGITGHEKFSIALPDQLSPGISVPIQTDDGKRFMAVLRFDTEVELEYYRHGGILNYMIRKMCA